MPTHSHRHDDNPGADERPVCFAGHYCRWHGVYREGIHAGGAATEAAPAFKPVYFRDPRILAGVSYAEFWLHRGWRPRATILRPRSDRAAIRRRSGQPRFSASLAAAARFNAAQAPAAARNLWPKFCVPPGDDESGSFAPFGHSADSVVPARPTATVPHHFPYDQNRTLLGKWRGRPDETSDIGCRSIAHPLR